MPAETPLATKPLLDTYALMKRTVERLAEHYVAPTQTYTLDLVVTGHERECWRFVMGATVQSISPDECDSQPPAMCTLTLSRALLEHVLEHPASFDLRSAQSLALGGARVTGTSRIAAWWIQLLKRPDATQRAALARARAHAPGSLRAVARVSRHDGSEQALLAQVLNALQSSTPLHLAGVLDWPETQWSAADWRVREGETVLPIASGEGQHVRVSALIDAFSDTAAQSATPYTEGCLLPPAWETRFAMPLVPRDLLGPGQLWAGRRSTQAVTRLHCDLGNSFLAQVLGRKRVRLYSPAQERALYALDAFNSYRVCAVDVDAPDFERHPRFAEAQGVDVLLAPGDLLVVPTGWFHCVWAVDDVLSVSRVLSDDRITRLRSLA